MFVNYILFGASFLATCYAESDQAVSSFSYERGDVPLSYKYNLVHIYTTSKPEVYSQPPQNLREQGNEQPQLNPQIEKYQYIQYAPLPLKVAEKSHRDYNTEPTSINTYSNEQEITTTQEHVQNNYIPTPTVPTQAPNYGRPDLVKYAPRYSLNLQPLNDNYMQNGLYTNPNLLIKNKQVRVNYFTPQLAYQTAEKTHDQQNVNAAKSQNQNILYTLLSHEYGQRKIGFNRDELHNKEKNALQPSYYVKTPKVALNVARTIKIAQAHPKASLNVKSSFRKLPTLPQDFFFNSQIELHNTQINPPQKKHVYMIHPVIRST